MFVRWKRRQRTRTGWVKRKGKYVKAREGTGEWVKSAVLVESVRTESGPRHKHVCYLGTIRERSADAYPARVHFWKSADRNLDRAGLAGSERERIVLVLESVVPKPDEASREAWRARSEQRLAEIELARIERRLVSFDP
jgi:hypothetical protein